MPAIATPLAPTKRYFTRSTYSAELVREIEPVDGWQLYRLEVEDGDRFASYEYFAARDDEEIHLPVSRFHWSPSQDRFAWLVRNRFPARPGKILAPWDDTEIEVMIALENAA